MPPENPVELASYDIQLPMPPLKIFRAFVGFMFISVVLTLIDEASIWLVPPDSYRQLIMAVAMGGMVFILAYRGGSVLRYLMGPRQADIGTRKRAIRCFRSVAGKLQRRVRLVVYEHHKMSAIAVHDGFGSALFVSSAMINEMGGEGLRGVFAHEIGHILERHNTKQAFILGFLAFAKSMMVPNGLVVAVVIMTYLAILRVWEFQADRRACDLVGAETMTHTCLEYLRISGEQRQPPQWLQWFMGHPSMSRRLAAISQRGGLV